MISNDKLLLGTFSKNISNNVPTAAYTLQIMFNQVRLGNR